MPFSISKSRLLFWTYAGVALAVAALVSLFPARWLSLAIEARLLERDATVSMQFVQTIVEALDVPTVMNNLPSSSLPPPYEAFFTQVDTSRVNAIFDVLHKRLAWRPDIVRMNVYGPDGARIWSTNPRLVGSRNLSNAKLVRALIGQSAVGVKPFLQDMAPSERARMTSPLTPLSEMYLPIRNTSRDGIVGVIELYKAPHALFQSIRQSQRWIWGGAVVGGAWLYALLLMLIPRWMRRLEQWRAHRMTAPPPKSLFQFYVVLALLFVALLIVGPTWALSGYINRRMLERDAVVTMRFAQALLEDMDAGAYLPQAASSGEAPTYADFFAQTDAGRIRAIFDDFSRRVPLAQLDIVRLSIYAPDGARIWSTQPKQVGIRWLGNDKLVRALNGELAVERGIVIYELAADEQDRITSEAPFYSEMYMPIWSPAGDAVVGVVEVYKDSAALFHAIAQGQRLFGGVMIGLGILLLALLLGVMRRAMRVMNQQRRTLAASETLSVVGEMVAAIAHLLRQPLAAIRASNTDLGKLQIDMAAPQVHDMQAEIDQLEAWLQGLQSYAQTHEHAIGAADLSAVLAGLGQKMSLGLDKQNIGLKIDAADDLPPVQADAGLLQQVFHTVVTNAQEAMPDGGALHIRARDRRPSPFVDIEICDTGHGMTPEQLRQVFQPFFTTKRRGLGIGLALTKRVIERQGGRIAIRSEAGRGTTVMVSLPIASGDGL